LTSSLKASESDNCQPDRSLTGNCNQLSEKELGSIKASNNPTLLMGSGIMSLASNSTSGSGKDFLESASRIESPKGVATITLLNYNLDPSRSLPLGPFKENISKLLQDDKDNALSYYVNALLLHEENNDQKALDQIKKGNTHRFNGYTKQRFYAIAQVAETNNCGVRDAYELAFWNSHSAAIYLKLRRVCSDFKKELGQDAQDACMILGKNLESSSLTCLEGLFSLATQAESLNQTVPDGATRADIKKRRDVLFSCGARTVDIQESDMTEEIVKRYYEIYLDKGEAAAQRFLNDIVNKKHKEN
jgi:hypothetical protein